MKVLITGASRGIGLATAKLFLENGHTVFAVSRKVEDLYKLKEQYDTLYIIQCDLSDDHQRQSMVEQLTSITSELDVLINNAGFLVNEEYEKTSVEDFVYSINVNLRVPYFLTQKLVPLLATSNGQIINIGSMGGYPGSSKFPGLSIYSTTKGAVATLTECLAEELKEKGIRANCLALGAVQTEMLEEAFPGYEADVQPHQMAEYILNFVTVSSKFVNGKVIPVSLNTP